jgi:hypothetical protein
MRGTLLLVALLLGALLACKSKSKSKQTGSISLNGAAFEIDQCRSGKANAPPFEGVDFLDAAGRRVRFLRNELGQVRTFVFQPGQLTGELVGEGCGTVSVTEQNSEVNGVKDVQGNVSASCSGGGLTVVASVNFENCH